MRIVAMLLMFLIPPPGRGMPFTCWKNLELALPPDRGLRVRNQIVRDSAVLKTHTKQRHIYKHI
jgi:hypothetical protein